MSRTASCRSRSPESSAAADGDLARAALEEQRRGRRAVRPAPCTRTADRTALGRDDLRHRLEAARAGERHRDRVAQARPRSAAARARASTTAAAPYRAGSTPSAMRSTGHSVMNVHHTVHETMPSVLPRSTRPMMTVPSPSMIRSGPHSSRWLGREHLDHADEHDDERPQVPPRESRHDLTRKEDEPDRDQEHARTDAAVALGGRRRRCGWCRGRGWRRWRGRPRRAGAVWRRCAVVRVVVLVTHSRSLPHSPAQAVRHPPNGSSG